ncbi:uncharacterized protein LOC143181885 [Calliopsis andreniformis]|uniref:uncharacterized protein LOC143181885 n=1 Tax=Calliopsis andreniformis TaxID=337506 RepID=UPI003FCC97C4
MNAHTTDQPFQRIYWTDNNNLLTYQLTTVTYGLASAPYLDEGRKYPSTVDVMSHTRYVDDIYGGADTIEEAQSQASQLNNLCMAGGFPLRKWATNYRPTLKHIPEQHHHQTPSIDIPQPVIPALGLSWNTITDMLHFRLDTSVANHITKRTLLSRIAQIFDTQGLLSPVTIQAKVFMQTLWILRLAWDTQLSEPQVQEWHRVSQAMCGVETIKIPRWIKTTATGASELHGFCDASQTAMAAVVYLQTVQSNNEINVAILCSKTKVAPLKRMTIPRLELTTAIMLTRLVAPVQNLFNWRHSSCHLWTDSSIVLTWLNNHSSRWQEFVYNRVCLIQETLPTAIWNHIAGKCNPADCATRRLSVEQLQNHQTWWSGPSWLLEDKSCWPTFAGSVPPLKHLSEKRNRSRTTILHTTASVSIWNLIFRYSSIKRLLRMTVICKRVLQRARKIPNTSLQFAIQPQKLEDYQRYWIRTTQRIHFATEFTLLEGNPDLPKSNPLTKLSPFNNTHQLLRVKVRLENSPLGDKRHTNGRFMEPHKTPSVIFGTPTESLVGELLFGHTYSSVSNVLATAVYRLNN